MKGLEAPVVMLTSVAFFGGHTAETRIEHTGSDPSGYPFTPSRGNKKGFYFSTGMFGAQKEAEKTLDRRGKPKAGLRGRHPGQKCAHHL